jgi:hypothetical protein
VVLLSLTSALSGCARYSYGQVKLGEVMPNPRKQFPEEKVRLTDIGACVLETDPFGRTDAIVILATRDQRVAGKMQASYTKRQLGFAQEITYTLTGELHPTLTDLRGSGPVDTLRALADELTGDYPDPMVRTAHKWVAAGLIRIIQRWPHVGDEGPALVRLTETLEQVPAGGTADIVVDDDGVHHLHYHQRITR